MKYFAKIMRTSPVHRSWRLKAQPKGFLHTVTFIFDPKNNEYVSLELTHIQVKILNQFKHYIQIEAIGEAPVPHAPSVLVVEAPVEEAPAPEPEAEPVATEDSSDSEDQPSKRKITRRKLA